jgi:hypothetical protein
MVLPQNTLKIEYMVENGKVKSLNQFLTVEGMKVHLIYNRNKNQTKTIVNGREEIQEGVMIM